jgi:hypothetical protein
MSVASYKALRFTDCPILQAILAAYAVWHIICNKQLFLENLKRNLNIYRVISLPVHGLSGLPVKLVICIGIRQIDYQLYLNFKFWIMLLRF